MQMSFSWRIRITGYTYILQRHPSGASINLHSSRFRDLQAYGLIGVIYSLENHGRSVSIKSKYGRETVPKADGDAIGSNLNALSCGIGHHHESGGSIHKRDMDATVIFRRRIHIPVKVDIDSDVVGASSKSEGPTCLVDITIRGIGFRSQILYYSSI